MGIFSNRKIRYFVAHLTLWSFIFHIFGLSALQIVYADDVTPPVVTIIWADPLIIAHGSTFSDPGASWTDDVDGSWVIQASSGTVDANTVGSYNLEYIYTDAALNPSNLVTRVVEVTDQTAPVITLSWANPFSLDLGTPYVDPG